MTVSVAADGTIVLDGICGAEDAEGLLGALLVDRTAAVDWRGCEGAHAAVLQVLLAARPPLRGPARSTLLACMILL